MDTIIKLYFRIPRELRWIKYSKELYINGGIIVSIMENTVRDHRTCNKSYTVAYQGKTQRYRNVLLKYIFRDYEFPLDKVQKLKKDLLSNIGKRFNANFDECFCLKYKYY